MPNLTLWNTTTTNAFIVPFCCWIFGKRVSNGSDEGILKSIQATKWKITRFSKPFDQSSQWILNETRFYALMLVFSVGLKYGLLILAHDHFLFGEHGHTIVAVTALVARHQQGQQDMSF